MQDRYQYGEDRPGNPSVAYTEQTQLRDIRKQLPLRVLSDSDFLHWQTRPCGITARPNGYMTPSSTSGTVRICG